MFTLVVLSALVAVSVAAPSGVISPLIYSSPSLAYVSAPSYALIGSVPTSISKQSSTVVHQVAPATTAVEVKAVESVPKTEEVAVADADAEVIETAPVEDPSADKDTKVVVESVPTSITSYSSQVFHDPKPIVAAPVIHYAGAPVLQYAAAPVVRYVPSAYPVVAPVSSYSTHGVVNSAGYISAGPIVHSF